MCGIVGYIGASPAVPYLVGGLEKLEYRGYDSAGIALIDRQGIAVIREKGRIDELKKLLGEEKNESTVGIGHTRWATHGEPCRKNAHPHVSQKGLFALVHNGIIENSEELRQELMAEGYVFSSETDTEVIAALAEKYYDGCPVRALMRTAERLVGSYALGVLCRDFPDRILCARKGSPLLLALDERGGLLFSDKVAFEGLREVYRLEDGEFAVLKQDNITFLDAMGRNIDKSPSRLADDEYDAGKQGYAHFMLKEIDQQPRAFSRTAEAYLQGEDIVFPGFSLSEDQARSLDMIYLVACGSAYNAAAAAQYTLQQIVNLPCRSVIASEFRYTRHYIGKNTLCVFISQSGETADTIAAMELARRQGGRTLSIINVPDSTMAVGSDGVIYTLAGTEIAVATTKAYSAQLAALYLVTAYLGKRRGELSEENYRLFLNHLKGIGTEIKGALALRSRCESLSRVFDGQNDIYFIGRKTDYALAAEGALKMKEISYLHCEAYAAGELKHGTISLIEEGTPVVAVCLRKDILKKTVSNISEVKARGAFVLAVTQEKYGPLVSEADEILAIPDLADEELSVPAGAVPLQLLSYYTALRRGCAIDKPRNLAKSVTVE
ncbi:MAG: glutamine--fructose-6-phosphate transaminase (isomerizing) [Acutalibacteraceae bacterium]